VGFLCVSYRFSPQLQQLVKSRGPVKYHELREALLGDDMI
jgi:hypothetical protein